MSNDSIIRSIHVENGIFWFYLEDAIVSEIMKRASTSEPLMIPRGIRRWLRKASFFDISEETASNSDRSQHNRARHRSIRAPLIPQSGLTFISCYPCQEPNENYYVLETIVSLDGDIFNKIKQQFLELETEHRQNVSNAHFWLVDQLLSTLRQDHDFILKIITSIGVSFPIVGGIAMSLQTLQNGSPDLQNVIAPLLGSGFSSLIYRSRQSWRSWIHKFLTRWGFRFIKTQIRSRL